MATKTTKICDRCGAQHEVDHHVSSYPVQDVQWVVPIGHSLHTVDYKKPNKKELCVPCRAEMAKVIREFMEAGK